MDSITIGRWEHIEHFGIKVLTGESCAYNMRLLCDVNEDGRLAMVDFLALPVDSVFASPWNSQVSEKPSVGSIMLHRDALPALAEFMLRRAGAKALVRLSSSGAVVGLFTDKRVEEYEQLLRDLPNSTHNWQVQRIVGSVQPCVGSRNVHAATGRAL